MMGLDKETVKFMLSWDFFRMSILWSLSVIYSYLKLFINEQVGKTRSYPRSASPPLPIKEDGEKPVCIVTGATSGLGAAAAKALAREGYCVILAGHSYDMLSKTIKDIKLTQNDAYLVAIEVDLSSLKSLFKFKDSIEKWLRDSHLHPSVQLLINNAGILATSEKYTVDGYERMMGTNYLGAFFLTKLLLPLLKNSYRPSRIVNVTSFTHRCVMDLELSKGMLAARDLKTLRSCQNYPFARLYECSKLCLLLFVYEFHRQLSLDNPSNHVSIIAADPGVVRTKIMREVPSPLQQLAFAVLDLLGLLQSAEDGISSILDGALAPTEAAGQYFFGGKGRTIESSLLSYNKQIARQLYTYSEELFHDAQHDIHI